MAHLWNTISATAKNFSNFVHEEILSRPPFNIHVQDERLRVALTTGLAVFPPALPFMAALAEKHPISPERSLKLLELEGEMTESLQAEAEFLLCPSPYFKMGPDVYRISKMPRGQCIIINNKDFEDERQPRLGSEIDVVHMRDLFRALHFDVCIASNLTAARMKQILSKVSEAQCDRSECLVVIVMSHGLFEKIEGVDGEYLDLMKDVYSLFNNENCPALQGKPKVFFIQACRGQNYDNGSSAGGSATADSNVQKSRWEPSDCTVSEEPMKRVPSWTDMFIAHATIRGHVALRNPEGSWFLSSVYEVFCRYAYAMDLQEMMRLVEKQIMERSSHDGSRQTASTTTYAWTKKLYFNVGQFL